MGDRTGPEWVAEDTVFSKDFTEQNHEVRRDRSKVEETGNSKGGHEVGWNCGRSIRL